MVSGVCFFCACTSSSVCDPSAQAFLRDPSRCYLRVISALLQYAPDFGLDARSAHLRRHLDAVHGRAVADEFGGVDDGAEPRKHVVPSRLDAVPRCDERLVPGLGLGVVRHDSAAVEQNQSGRSGESNRRTL
jgi:hypothetical protein